MIHSAVTSMQHWSGLPAYLIGYLLHPEVFCDFMSRETFGSGSAGIRLEFQCTDRVIQALPVCWEQSLIIIMTSVTALDGKESPAPVSPSSSLG